MTIASGQSEGTTEVTPSGIEIFFQSQPKRLYRVRSPKRPDGSHNYDWREVPSVTTVLGVLDKSGPLIWWGQGIGGIGVLKLQALNVDFDPVLSLVVQGRDDEARAELCAILTKYQLSTNHVRDKAGSRGQAVHDALETWAKTGHKPDPSIYPPEEKGYVEGLLAFLADVPSAEPEACEVLVASVEHGYAGRYDIRLRTSLPHDVVVHRTPVKGPVYRTLAPGTLLADLKSSKGIYGSHSRQLEAYEEASIESGYEPTDARGILHVDAEGNYAFKRSWATFEDFRVVLDVWKSDQEMKEREKADRKRAA